MRNDTIDDEEQDRTVCENCWAEIDRTFGHPEKLQRQLVLLAGGELLALAKNRFVQESSHTLLILEFRFCNNTGNDTGIQLGQISGAVQG